MTDKIVEYDRGSLSSTQLELHGLAAIETPSRGPPKKVVTPFLYAPPPTAWYSKITEVLTSSDNNIKEAKTKTYSIKYQSNYTMDRLLVTTACQKWPALRVKDECRGLVEICWTHNIGSNIFAEGLMMFGTKPGPRFDAISCDIYNQHYRGKDRLERAIDLGNVEAMENWGNHLPVYRTTFTLPFFNQEALPLAIPLVYCRQNQVSYHFTLKRGISTFLRMRRRDTPEGPFRIIKPDLRFLEGVPEDGLLEIPQIIGQYAKQSEEEIRYEINCRDDEEDPRVTQERIIYFRDIVSLDDKNPTPSGVATKQELKSEYPIRAVHWVAENVTAQKRGNLSNYTTNPDNLQAGYNPMSNISIDIPGIGSRVGGGLPTEYFSRTEPDRHSLSRPDEEGYCMWSPNLTPYSIYPGVAIGNKGPAPMVLHVTPGSQDPYDIIREDGNEIDVDDFEISASTSKAGAAPASASAYVLRVRLEVMRKMVFKKGPSGADGIPTFEVIFDKEK